VAFEGLMKGWQILDWLGKRPAGYRVAMLSSDNSYCMADIHERSFFRPWSAEEFEHMLSGREVVADGLFINHGKQLGGFVMSRIAADEGEILTIALDPSVRNKGLSSLLLKEHLHVLQQRCVNKVFLEVDENNVAALALYRAVGFRENGRRSGYYHGAAGRTTSAVMMTIDL
jgi:ribosomal-protein-alanine N-acetyltransferase